MLKRLFLLLLVVAVPTTRLHAMNDSFVGKWKLNPGKEHDARSDEGSFQREPTATLSTLAAARNSLLSTALTNPVSKEVPSRSLQKLLVCGESFANKTAVCRSQPFGRFLRTATRCATTSPVTRPTAPVSPSITSTHPLEEPLALPLCGIAPAKSPARSKSRCSSTSATAFLLVNQKEHSTKNMNFDGKDYPVKDANAAAGAMSSARRVNASTLEFTEKRNGKVADTQHIELSPDGKTLTMTVQPASGRKPNVLVFERE